MSKRLVVISGSARWDQLTGLASNLPFYLKKAFANDGFEVVDITAESQSFANNNVNLELKFNVYYQFSNQEVLARAKYIIENFSYDSVLGNKDTELRFDNVYLRVTYDAGIPSISTISGSVKGNINTNSKNNSTSSNKTQPINIGTIATVDVPFNETGNNFLDNLFQDLGISKPSTTTIVVAAILGIIILRKL